MGCSTSNPTLADGVAPKRESTASAPPEAAHKYPASEAFVIPLDQSVVLPIDEFKPPPPTTTTTSPSTAKRLPKRIQQLMQQSVAAAAAEKPNNLSDLEDKLHKAEQRRQQFLRQKIENIQKTTQMAAMTPGHAAIHNTALDDDSKQQLLARTIHTESSM